MKPAPFEYHRPDTAAEVVELLGEYEDEAKVLAGGQSLMPVLAMRLTRFEHIVDLNGISELSYVRRDGDVVRIGAMTRQRTVEHDDMVAGAVPLLTRAIPLIGHFQIRNRGTIGGSLSHASPQSELPAAALALDAEMHVDSPDGGRDIAAKDFFVSTLISDLASAELLTEIRFPVWSDASGFAAEELARRHGDFALAGTMVAISIAGGSVSKAAISLFSMAPTPVRATAAEQALVGTAVDDIDFEEIAQLSVAGLTPPADVHADAAYRTKVAPVLVARALRRAVDEAKGK